MILYFYQNECKIFVIFKCDILDVELQFNLNLHLVNFPHSVSEKLLVKVSKEEKDKKLFIVDTHSALLPPGCLSKPTLNLYVILRAKAVLYYMVIDLYIE